MERTHISKPLTWALSFALLCGPVLPAQDKLPAKAAAPARILDVALTAQGNLAGRVLNSQGKAVDGARVVLWKEQQKLRQVSTDREGRFQMDGLRSGLYRLEAPGQSVSCRVWSAEIAPPTAKSTALLVQGPTTVRGQYGMWDPVNTTAIILGITGVTLSAITLSEVNNTNSKVDNLIKKVDELASP